MRMQLAIVTIVSAVLSTAAFAQKTEVKGNTEIKASQENTAAVAIGQDNTAKNTAGAIKGNTKVQGNTKIQAAQKNTAAVAIGKGNTASNEAGVIGGK